MAAIIFVLLLFATSALGYPTVVVPVDWADVPVTAPAARNLDSPYLGECVCDVTWGICDPFCCCDTDCDTSTINSFSYCLPETFSSPYLDYCYPKDRATSLRKINNIDATYIDKKKQGYNAVCVIRANHPSELYKYFKVPTTVEKPAIQSTSAPAIATNQTYAVGSLLVFAKLVSTSTASSYRRTESFRIPTVGSNGACLPPGRAVGFLDPLQGASCVLNGAQICDAFPTTRYTNLFVQSIEWYDGSTQAMIPMTLNILNTSNAVVDTIDPSEATTGSSFLSFADTDTCHNAVTTVSTQFTYATNASGTIISAVVNVTVADVGLGQFVPFTFQTAFVAENKSLPASIIAGTPGYLPGRKVRAGTLVTNSEKSAILERESGFAVPGGGRACSAEQWKRTSFLYSVLSSGCVVPMSESELQSWCSTGTAGLISSLINGTVDGVGTAFDRIAVTNDALANDTSSWIAIDGLSRALTSSPGTYNQYSRACENIMVGLHYQFVIARAGAEYNAQDIIIGAFVSPISGTLKIQNQTSFDSSATSLQRITFKVSFSRYDPDSQATIRRRVVAPPILPRLDDTIFYPFRSPYPL